MTTQQIAADMATLIAQGKYAEAHEKYYAETCKSIEPAGVPNNEVQGMDAIRGKGEWWAGAFETHSVEVGQPIVTDTNFALTITLDAAHKESGMRSTSTEIAVYTVEDGKVVAEQFFFKPQPM